MEISQIQIHIDEYKKKISDYQINNKYDLLIMMFTSVKGDGTMFMFYGPKSEIMGEIIEETFDFNSGFDKKIISRKQQLVPILSKKLSEYQAYLFYIVSTLAAYSLLKLFFIKQRKKMLK